MIKNYWKYIVVALLAFVAIFHLAVIWYIWGRDYELTSHDYYAREIDYQDQIERLRAGQAFDWSFQINSERNYLVIEVRDKAGNPIDLKQVHAGFYRPDNSALDLAVPLSQNPEGAFHARLDPLKPGAWRLNVTGTVGGQPLAWETKVNLL